MRIFRFCLLAAVLLLMFAGGARGLGIAPSTTNTIFAGKYDGPGTFVGGGVSAWRPTSAGFEFRMGVRGTAFAVNICTNTNAVYYSVDGGAWIAFSNTSYVYGNVALFTGLSDTVHSVVIQDQSGVTYPFLLDSSTGGYTVTGGSPAVLLPTSGQQFGPVIGTNPPGTYNSPISFADPSVPTFLRVEGDWTTGTYNGQAQLKSKYTDTNCAFYATIDSICASIYGFGQKIRVYVDGVGLLSTVIVNDGRWQMRTLATGLDATKEHFYEIVVCSTNTCAQNVVLGTLLTTGGTGVNQAKTFTARPRIACFGDSITEAEAGTSNESSFGFMALLCRKYGVENVNKGIGGRWVTTDGGATAAGSNTAEITTLSPAPKVCFLELGTNDSINGEPVGTLTSGKFAQQYNTMLSTLTTACPNTLFVCFLMPRWVAGTPINDSGFVGAIQTAVANVGNTSKAIFIDMPGLSGLIASDFSDGTHPVPTGYLKIQAALAPYVQPYSTIISGVKRRVQ